jgi:ankyrin repeat protein
MRYSQILSRLLKSRSYLLVIAGLSLSAAVQAQALEDSLRAALEGDLVTLQKLLDRGTSPDTSDADGNTLLMMAARGGHLNAAEFLVSRKASVNKQSAVGDTALMAASLKGQLPVVRFLLENGAILNPPNWTPLHYAAFEGRTAVVRFLLEKGANKDAVAPNEYTALMLAVRGSHEETARMILYADPDVRHKTGTGDTALKLAVQKGYGPLVDLLKRAGATE